MQKKKKKRERERERERIKRTYHKKLISITLLYPLPLEARKKRARKSMEHITIYAITLPFLLFMTQTLAQPAAAPAPPGPTNITKILEKAGQFTTFMRLLKSTQVGDQINQQLNDSNSGLTVFAPSDNAFSSLSAGILNSLTDQQKVALIQFHVLPSFISTTQFQTVSNPLRTQAGDVNNGQFPLNVTTTGNTVNITTGIVNTTVSNTIYSDNQLAVYQVDQVLLPLDIFGPHAPAPAPSIPKKKKAAPIAEGPSSTSKDSAAVSLNWRASAAAIAFAAAVTSLWWSL